MRTGYTHDAAALAGAIGTAALGAAAMYAFDPDRGQRRRAIARDTVRRLASDLEHFAATAARDASDRTHGLSVKTLRRFRNDGPVPASAATARWSPSLRSAAILGGALLVICGALAGVRGRGF